MLAIRSHLGGGSRLWDSAAAPMSPLRVRRPVLRYVYAPQRSRHAMSDQTNPPHAYVLSREDELRRMEEFVKADEGPWHPEAGGLYLMFGGHQRVGSSDLGLSLPKIASALAPTSEAECRTKEQKQRQQQQQPTLLDLTQTQGIDDLQQRLSKLDPASEVLCVNHDKVWLGHTAHVRHLAHLWPTIRAHFPAAKRLVVRPGDLLWLSDEARAIDWQLDQLVLVDAPPDPANTPYITQGRVKELVLFCCWDLRFSGITNDEYVLNIQHQYGWQTSPYSVYTREGTQIPVFCPTDITKYEHIRVAEQPPEARQEEIARQMGDVPGQQPRQPRLESLKIIGNDATETFDRFCATRPDLTRGLKSVYLEDTYYPRLEGGPAPIPLRLPSGLAELCPDLKELRLAITRTEHAEPVLSALRRNLPPSLETLQIRSLQQLADSQSPLIDDWVRDLSDPDFQSRLKTLGFLLDTRNQSRGQTMEEVLAATKRERVFAARRACERIWTAAEARGATVVDGFVSPMSDISPSLIFYPVHPFWHRSKSGECEKVYDEAEATMRSWQAQKNADAGGVGRWELDNVFTAFLDSFFSRKK